MRKLFLLMLFGAHAWALDKQGSAHGGDVGGSDTEFNLSGSLMLGIAPYNPSYAARPDNTGIALFRYALHGELSVYHDMFSLVLDATMFTDRTAKVVVRPSELDFTADFVFHWKSLEAHIAYERDMPVDSPGYVQQFVYLLTAWSFDFHDVFHPTKKQAG